MADIRQTPVANYPAYYGSGLLKALNEAASKPFGYENDPVRALTNLLGIPAATKTLENIAYGMPNVIGTGMATQLRPEAKETVGNILPMAPGVAKLTTRGLIAGGEYLAPKAGQMAEQYVVNTGLLAPLTAYHVSPNMFSKFDLSKAGSGFGSLRGQGTYLSATPEASAGYAAKLEQPTFYKVDLPDKIAKDFLTWDKPVPSNLYKKANDAAIKQFGGGLNDISGDTFYNSVVSNFERLGSKNPAADASSWLNTQGIKGMEYQTGKAGERKNYVVYDPSVLTILEKGSKPFTQQTGLLGAKESDVLYHGTTPQAAKAIEKSGFDINKSADGTIWFTSNPNIGEVAASGKGGVVKRILDKSKVKLGGWEEADKYSTNELMNMGYDGLALKDKSGITYQIFNPEKLKK